MSLIPRSFYLDDIFENLERTPKMPHEMKCDIYETDGNYNIEMDVPGYDKKDITIVCENGLLTITAEKKMDNENADDNRKYIRRERFFGKVTRTFNFAEIDEDSIKAEFNNGCLKVIIPKLVKNETKKVINID